MATGYTHDVQTGKVTEFPEFAMQCARAFGALISMRDDPADAPIPDHFEPSPYYVERIPEYQAEVDRLAAMSTEEIEVAAHNALARARATHEEDIATRRAARARYEAMLAKVADWEPPTPEHVEMKEFMSDQLRQSIEFDCSERYLDAPDPADYTPAKWHERTTEAAGSALARAISGAADERRRAEQRTRWIVALRASLKQSEPA